MRKLVLVAAFVLLGIGNMSAEIILVHTSCGKTANLDNNRGTSKQLADQAKAIDKTLCPDGDGGSSNQPQQYQKVENTNLQKVE